IPVLRYRVIIDDGPNSEDIVDFFLETTIRDENARTAAEKQLRYLSDDFIGGIQEGLVKLKVTLVKPGELTDSQPSQKLRDIVIDRRRYSR
nr:hypothetical protein [Candidatus Sigynarchaeota archaeon]